MLLHDLPEALSADGKKPLISEQVGSVISESLGFVKQRIRVFHEWLDGAERTLEPLNVEMSVGDVISR